MSDRRRIWIEALGFWLITAVSIRVAVSAGLSPNWLAIVKSLALIYLPLLWLFTTKRDFDDYGLTLSPLGLSLAVFAIVSLVTLIPFYAGTYLLSPVWSEMGFLRGDRFTLRFPPDLAALFAAEVLSIALPEEVFYRGYLQTRLDQALPARRNILGAQVGWALPISSAIFVAGHLAVSPAPWQLAIFFPSLVFGWMRARTGSLVAPILYHALCNVGMMVLQRSFR